MEFGCKKWNLGPNLNAYMQDEADTPNKKDVPVFLFSNDFPLPVFVDKHYQARSLTVRAEGECVCV